MRKNFFEESRAVNLLLLNEANLAGTSKLENIKKITELCQRCLIYNWLQQKRKWNSEVSEGI